MTPLKQVHDRFIELEAELGLWSETIAGLEFWHPLRLDVYGEVLKRLGLMGERHANWKSRPVKERVMPEPRRWLSSIQRSLWTNITQRDMVVLNHNRHLKVDGHWQCAYSQPLIEELPCERYVLEQAFHGLHYYPQKAKGLKYLDAAMLLGSLGVYARHGVSSGVSPTELGRYLEILNAIGQKFDVVLESHNLVRLLKEAVRRELGLGRAYKKFLYKAQPKVVMEVVHYSHRVFPATRAAKELGIPVVEIQHGLIGPQHLPYNLAPKAECTSLPDYFLLFGDFWRDLPSHTPFTAEQTPAIGYAHLERARSNLAAAPKAGKQRILFLSQGTIGKQLSRWAAHLANTLPASDYQVIYKLHPSEVNTWHQNYPELKRSSATVLGAGGLYEAFASADFQVGVYSTALFEGLTFGLETILAALPGHLALEPLVKSGAARLAESESQLLEFVKSPLQRDTYDTSHIFKPKAVQNFRQFIQRFVSL